MYLTSAGELGNHATEQPIGVDIKHTGVSLITGLDSPLSIVWAMHILYTTEPRFFSYCPVVNYMLHAHI